MNIIQTNIPGVLIIEPRVFKDSRGYFFENFSKREFDEPTNEARAKSNLFQLCLARRRKTEGQKVTPILGHSIHFVQDNQSMSSRGVLRGLHYQKGAASQAKLVRVLQGCVLDVAVDLRASSPTFGRYIAVELSADNRRQLFIPRGFAHGFQVLSDTAVFTYKVDNAYCPEAECSIRFDDPAIGIEWPITGTDVVLSDKDLNKAVSFEDAEKF